MSDIPAQPSDQPMPSDQSPTHFSGKPMTTRQPGMEALASSPSVQRRLRLWPGVAIFAVQWAIVGALQLLFSGEPLGFMSMLIGPMIGTVVLLLWWLFFSRLSWRDRLGVPAACLVIVALVVVVAHSIDQGHCASLLHSSAGGGVWDPLASRVVSAQLAARFLCRGLAGPPCRIAARADDVVRLLHAGPF